MLGCLDADPTLNKVFERHDVCIVRVLRLQDPTLPWGELGYDTVQVARLLLGLDGQGHLLAHQRLEPILIRLQLVRNLIALLCQLKNSLNSLHCIFSTRDVFICD